MQVQRSEHRQSRRRATISRFELSAKLGYGLQGSVYKAHDPHLDRVVAIKLLNGTQVQPEPCGENAAWLTEGRNLGKLKHPNVISIYEAGDIDGIPFLVFEYVEGTTLKEALAGGMLFTVAESIHLMRQIVDGVAHAHKQSVLHLDLSPGNIMLDTAGVARIMDFGLSRIMSSQQPDDDVIVGTPRYMSPEHFTTTALGPATDVFALGLMWYETLTGEPANTGNTPEEIRSNVRVNTFDLSRLRDLGAEPELVGIIGKALRNDPSTRIENAIVLKELLDNYFEPKRSKNGIADGIDEQHSTVQFLLRRMERKQDFPALSSSLITINQMTSDDSTASAKQLANVVLRDYAVSNKLLKLANSAFYGSCDRGVTKVSEAIRRLGVDQVRTACNSLIYFNHMQDWEGTEDLQDALIISFISGLIARHLAAKSRLRDLEEAFICGMFRNLGRTLAIYYFAEDYSAIRDLVEQHDLGETQAFVEVLGVPASVLGITVAKSWKFPDVFVDAMQALDETQVSKPTSHSGRILVYAAFANELCAIAAHKGSLAKAERLAALRKRYEFCFRVSDAGLCKLLRAGVEKFHSFAQVLDLVPAETPCIQRMTDWLALAPSDNPAATVAAQQVAAVASAA